MQPISQLPENHKISLRRTFVQEAESQVEATIASLKQRFEEVRQREVKRTSGRMGGLSCAQENAIESLTLAIVDHILDTPVSVLKAASEDNDSRQTVEKQTVRRFMHSTCLWKSFFKAPRGRTLPSLNEEGILWAASCSSI